MTDLCFLLWFEIDFRFFMICFHFINNPLTIFLRNWGAWGAVGNNQLTAIYANNENFCF